MNRSFVFSICCTFLFLAACNKDPKSIQIDLNKSFELELNQSADFQEGEFEIIFAEVNEDSRCPTEVVCVWEGEVIITLNVRELDAITPIEMTRNGALDQATPTVATYKNYEILLTEVSPYPKNENAIKEKDYELTLEVREF